MWALQWTGRHGTQSTTAGKAVHQITRSLGLGL
jgi:hypothetical protein